MNQKIKELLACPKCHGNLKFKESEIFCTYCNSKYEEVKGIPFFIKNKFSNEEMSVGGFRDKLRKNIKCFARFTPKYK